jgi:hypothetical protein
VHGRRVLPGDVGVAHTLQCDIQAVALLLAAAVNRVKHRLLLLLTVRLQAHLFASFSLGGGRLQGAAGPFIMR